MIIGYHLIKGITACSTGEVVIGDNRRQHLDLLLKYHHPEYLCVFWHMEAAMGIIIKELFRLKKEQAEILNKTSELKGTIYTVKHYPSKFMSIRAGNYFKSPLILFSDMSQFNECVFTLNETANECIQKAKEAQLLGDKAINAASKLDISPKTLTSPISIFEKKYFSKYVGKGIPNPFRINIPITDDYPDEIREGLSLLAKLCSHGGWVESFWKGFFPNSSDWDISGAYSFYESKLLDHRFGEWVRSAEYQPNAQYGFCVADVSMTSSFHPILYNTDIENHYTPIGFYRNYAIQKQELDIIDEYKLGSYKIKDGYWWTCKRPYRPLNYIIQRVTKLKQETEGFDKEFMKKVLNGMWGKLSETHKEETVGDLYNPVWGSHVEMQCRLDVFRFCMKALNEGRKVLHIAVDGVLTDEPVSFIDRSVEKQPGKWRLEANCPSLVISSGCVAIQDKMGKGEFGMDYNWLVEQIKKNPKKTEYPETKLSPMTLAKCINLGQYDRIGEIEEITKTIDIYADTKRQYPKEPKNGGELLKGQFESVPLDMIRIHDVDLSDREDDGD